MKERIKDIREWIDKLAASWGIAVAKGGVHKLQFESDAINFVEDNLMNVEKLLDHIEKLEAILYADENGSVMKDIIAPLHDKVEKQDKVIEVYEPVNNFYAGKSGWETTAVIDRAYPASIPYVDKGKYAREAQAKVKEIMNDSS